MRTQIEILTETVDRLVRETINEMFIDEKEKVHHSTKWERKKWKSDNKKQDDEGKKNAKKTKAATRRARVIKWLQDPTVNCAEIMRKLWKPKKKKEDAARSYFYKCRDGELNDSGVAYSFSDKDINRLYAIMNNLK